MGDEDMAEPLPVPDDDEPQAPTPLRAVQAEVVAEQTALPDGSMAVILRTELGEAPITVPPIRRWRASARNAIFSRMDDLFWAAKTLSAKDATTWLRLDPTQEEAEGFFAALGEATGQAMVGEAQAASPGSRPSSPPTRGR